MAGVFLWGWDAANKRYLKVLVDTEGKVKTVAVIDNLDDIGDVNVPTPTDNNLLYWDDAAGEWKAIAHLGVTDAHHAATVASDLNHQDLANRSADNHHAKYTDVSAVAAAKTVKLDDFATPDNNTDLDFSTARHGLVPKGTDVGDFLRDDGTWASAGGVADYPMKLKPNLTRWVVPGWYANRVIATQFTGGRIYYTPIFVEETTTYIRMGINITISAAGSADLRIFAWDDGVPGALLLSAGTIDTGSTGLKEIVISHQLTRGYYFLAIRCSVLISASGFDAGYAVMMPIGGFHTAIGALERVILTRDASYADPAPAPTNALSPSYNCVRLREN